MSPKRSMIALLTLAMALVGCDDGLECWPGGDGLNAARAHNGLPILEGWDEDPASDCDP